jgi:glutamine synthetase
MIYYIDAPRLTKEEIIERIKSQTNVLFVSLSTVDLGGNHTDERIPVREFIENYDEFMLRGIPTDGSSVELPGIANIDNAKVDIIPDKEVRWLIDYSSHHFTEKEHLSIGTLVIPSFLYHSGKPVGSRSVLKRATETLERDVREMIEASEDLQRELDIELPIKDVEFSLATELEFWVHSPTVSKDDEDLFVSQKLKEQYWKRPTGAVRDALEDTLIALEKLGYTPEMGHKEVGGVGSKLRGSNEYVHMEQIEIDWRYDHALQAADNELFARNIVFDIFAKHGLDVTFKAKPIDGVAGSGEHHHVSITVTDARGEKRNVFAPNNMQKDFLSPLGFGALMGILNHYESINPFVSNSNDAFNRLTPGFEAPVSTVCSLGMGPDSPSRNRTVLLGLIRDTKNKLATRFELRSPNVGSNSYLLSAAVAAAMIDGMLYAKDKKSEELFKELNKEYGEEAVYLKKDRKYRSEVNIYTDYTEEDRVKLFGKAPRTVFEVIEIFRENINGFLTAEDIFTDAIIESYLQSIHDNWLAELTGRIIPEYVREIRELHMLHDREPFSQLDKIRWNAIHQEMVHLMKDTHLRNCLFTRLLLAVEEQDYALVSKLQLEAASRIKELKHMYSIYRKNIIHLKE